MPWNLIIGGIVFLVVSAGIVGVIHTHDVKVKTAALAPWKPLTTKCEAMRLDASACEGQWTGAVNGNLSLQEDLKKLDAERQACTKNTQDLKRQAALADAAKRDAELAAKKAKQSAKQGEEAQQARLDAGIKKAVTCPQGVSSIGDNLIKVGKDQLEAAKPPETIKVR